MMRNKERYIIIAEKEIIKGRKKVEIIKAGERCKPVSPPAPKRNHKKAGES
jgi:hypothetical protein